MLFALVSVIQCSCIYAVYDIYVQVEIYKFGSITLAAQFLPPEAVKTSGISARLSFTCQDISSTLILLLSHGLLIHAAVRVYAHIEIAHVAAPNITSQ